jgi:hypothetical protein
VPYASVDLQRLPVEADDVISAVSLIVSSENPSWISIEPVSGAAGIGARVSNIYGDPSVPGTSDFIGNPITYDHADTLHTQYNQKELFQLGYIDPILKKNLFTLTSNFNMTNTSNAFDSSLSTYANNTASGNAYVYGFYTNALAINTIGGDFEYSTADTFTGDLDVLFSINRFDGIVYRSVIAISLRVAGTGSHSIRNRVRILCKYDGTDTVAEAKLQLMAMTTTVADEFRVYDVQRLEFNPNLLNIAKAQIVLPAQVVGTIEMDGIPTPVKAVTVTGTPSGNLTGDSAEWTFKHEIDGLRRTIISLGNKQVSEESRVIKILAQDLDRRDQQNARAYSDLKARR